MSTFSDYFSDAAPLYAAYRPCYPESLYDWLAERVPRNALVWDCGTGNGQAAVSLAGRFSRVIASDPSQSQLANATRARGIDYVVATAEDSPIRSGSVELVTVAQALHWFDRSRFFGEAERVMTPGALIAVWSYGLISVDPAVDAELAPFYGDKLGGWWPPERAIVDAGYASLRFPFLEITAPAFVMEARWNLSQFAGYLSSWSAITRYRRALGVSPVDSFVESIRHLWDPGESVRRVSWPLQLRVGHVPQSA